MGVQRLLQSSSRIVLRVRIKERKKKACTAMMVYIFFSYVRPLAHGVSRKQNFYVRYFPV